MGEREHFDRDGTMSERTQFEAQFSWRCLSTLIIGICSMAMAVLGAWIHSKIYFDGVIERLVSGELDAWMGALASVLFLLLVAIPFSYVGISYFWRFFRNKCDVIIVNTSGITIDKQRIEWGDVAWIGGQRRLLSKKIDLVLKDTSSHTYPRSVKLDSPLSETEFFDLMAILESAISPKMKHVRFGYLRFWHERTAQ